MDSKAGGGYSGVAADKGGSGDQHDSGIDVSNPEAMHSAASSTRSSPNSGSKGVAVKREQVSAYWLRCSFVSPCEIINARDCSRLSVGRFYFNCL